MIAPSYDGADLVVVNTCGFIDAAVAESLDAIGEALAENGKVIVTGCLGAKGRHRAQGASEGAGRHRAARDRGSDGGGARAPAAAARSRSSTWCRRRASSSRRRHYAYLKISEGCNHRCTFCIIPSMRGDLVSRPIGEVMQEAENLVKAGVQGTAGHLAGHQRLRRGRASTAPASGGGRPLKTRMTELARALGELGHARGCGCTTSIRIRTSTKCIPLMAEGKILPYLDVPFQHASPRILKLMKRPANAENMLARIRAWRAICPDITIRSTFIVGFPGETEAEFEELLDFLDEAQLDRVGCFAYSPVEGAAANALPDPVPQEVREERRARFMQTQEGISAARLDARSAGRWTCWSMRSTAKASRAPAPMRRRSTALAELPAAAG